MVLIGKLGYWGKPAFRMPLHRTDIFRLIFQRFRQVNYQVIEKSGEPNKGTRSFMLI